MFDLGPDDIRFIVQGVVVLVISICVHEYGHAIVADKLGDRLPRSQGRTTLNPLAHADPIGTFLFPLVGMVLWHQPGFGWGRPVMVNPHHFSRRFTMRTGHLMVAAAGPAMNVLLATLTITIHALLVHGSVIPMGLQAGSIAGVLHYAVGLNFILAFFNLIPAKPLDGGTIMEGLIPSSWVPSFERFSVYGPFVLMGAILIPGASRVFIWPATQVTNGLYAVVGLHF